MRAWRTGPLRRGNAITAAPLRDGTYQPASRSPSLVLSDTSTYGRPRSTGLHGRPGLVVRDDRKAEPNEDEHGHQHRANPDQRPPQVAPQRSLVEPARAPKQRRAERHEHDAADTARDRRHVVAAERVDGDVAGAVDHAAMIINGRP